MKKYIAAFLKLLACTLIGGCTLLMDLSLPPMIPCEHDGMVYHIQAFEYRCIPPEEPGADVHDVSDVADTGFPTDTSDVSDSTDAEATLDTGTGDVFDTDTEDVDTVPPLWPDIEDVDVSEETGTYIVLVTTNDRSQLKDPYLHQLVEEEWTPILDEDGEGVLVNEPFPADHYEGERLQIFEHPLQRVLNPCNKLGIELPPCPAGEVCVVKYPRYTYWGFEDGLNLRIEDERREFYPTLVCITEVEDELPVSAEEYCPHTSSVFHTELWGWICAETGYLVDGEQPGPISRCATMHPACEGNWFTSAYLQPRPFDFSIEGEWRGVPIEDGYGTFLE